MKFLIQKDESHTSLLRRICLDTLSLELKTSPQSNEFCGIYIDGRNREINFAEDFAVLHSFNFFSEYEYPLLILSPNSSNLFNSDTKYSNIQHIKIPELKSHALYSEFSIKNLWNYIPEKYEKLLFMHPDGFLIKSGWEKFISDINVDYIGSAWCHFPGVEVFHEEKWSETGFPKTLCGNGGFSYRRRSICKKISETFSSFKLRESGTENKFPPEDLFYSHFINGSGAKIANLKQCMKFSLDPITPNEYEEKISFGFHHPVGVNEFQKHRDYYLNFI